MRIYNVNVENDTGLSLFCIMTIQNQNTNIMQAVYMQAEYNVEVERFFENKQVQAQVN